MCRRSCFMLILLLVLVGNASAATLYNEWKGTTTDWNTGTNWNLGSVPFITDGTDMIKAGFKAPETAWPLITSATLPVPEADVITLGGASGGFLSIDSGTLKVGQYITMGASAGENGIFYINGGTVITGQRTTNAHLFVGQQGVGTVYMNGGVVNLVGGIGTTGNLRIADVSTASGNLYLNAGTIYANDLLMPFAAAGSLEINGGTLVLNGDDTAAVGALVLAGKVTTTLPGGSVLSAYDEDSMKTLVWAIPEPATICLLGFGVLGLLSRKK